MELLKLHLLASQIVYFCKWTAHLILNVFILYFFILQESERCGGYYAVVILVLPISD